MHEFLDAARRRVVIYDGATGTNLQLRQLGPDDFGGPALEGCNELLCATRPDVVADLHRSFLDVGVDVVETNSFGALPWVLAEYGIAERTRELAYKSARLAREVAAGYPGRWVAGSLGPGTKIASLGQIGFAEQRDGYQVAAEGLLEGGVDLFVIETVQDLLQAKAAVIGCRRAMAHAGRQVPLQVQVTIELTGRMLMGTEIGAALTTLDALRPDVIGLNCATGPEEMGEHLRYLSQHAATPVSCLPNAGLPSVVDGRMHYDLTPDSWPSTRPASSPSTASRWSAAAAGRRRLTWPRWWPAAVTSTRPPAGWKANGAAPPSTATCPSTRAPRCSSSASAPTPTAPGASARRCSTTTGTPPWPWRASR